jgi:hypothetical protein
MNEFKKYQHVERMGTVETEGILNGLVYIFPKIDGANGSIWFDPYTNTIKCGSRKSELNTEHTNRGF